MLRTLRDALIALIVERSVNWLVPSALPYAWTILLLWLTWDVLRLQPVRERIDRLRLRQINPMLSFLIVFMLGGILACLYWWVGNKVVAAVQPAAPTTEARATPAPSQSGLNVSFFKFKYDRETQELSAKVQFVNNDTVRRTVLGTAFFYRLKDERDFHPYIKFGDELFGGGDGDAVYVEPHQPIVNSYKFKLIDSQPTTLPGTRFGLTITTVGKEAGNMNQTSVECLIASVGFSNDVALISVLKRDISLDEPFKSVQLDDPVVHLPESPGEVNANGMAVEKPEPESNSKQP